MFLLTITVTITLHTLLAVIAQELGLALHADTSPLRVFEDKSRTTVAVVSHFTVNSVHVLGWALTEHIWRNG